MKRHGLTILAILLLGVSVGASPASMPPNLQETIQAQQDRLQEEPSNAAAWNDLGNLLVEVGMLEDAELAYRRAIDLRPLDAAPRFNLSVLLLQDGQLDRAKEEIRAVIDLDPSHAWARYQMGVILAASGERREAVRQYAQALAIDPLLSFASNNPHILDNPLFGEALLMSQRYTETLAGTVPRQYGEPQRIRDLLLNEEEVAGEKASTEAESEMAEGEVEGEEAEEPRRGRPVRDESEDPRPGTARSAGAPPPSSAPPSSSVAPDDRQPRRVDIDPGTPGGRPAPVVRAPDNRAVPGGRAAPDRRTTGTPVGRTNNPSTQPSRRGEAAQSNPGNPAGVRPQAAVPLTGRRLVPNAVAPGPAQQPTEAEGAEAAPPPPRSGGSRYIPPERPGRRSTAQLNLRLLPEENAAG